MHWQMIHRNTLHAVEVYNLYKTITPARRLNSCGKGRDSHMVSMTPPLDMPLAASWAPREDFRLHRPFPEGAEIGVEGGVGANGGREGGPYRLD